MTTIATLNAQAESQARTVSAWVAKANAKIEQRVSDAHAHASKALTATLRNTPDGRATAARARRSPSYVAAVHRLGELAKDLISLIAKARESFYRESLTWHVEHLPDEWLRSADPEPRQTDLSWVRGMALHGTPLVTEITEATNSAARQLLQTVAQVSSRAIPEKAADDMLTAWQTKALRSIGATVRSLLSDSQIMADRKAGRDVIDPKHLEPDPTLPKG